MAIIYDLKPKFQGRTARFTPLRAHDFKRAFEERIAALRADETVAAWN